MAAFAPNVQSANELLGTWVFNEDLILSTTFSHIIDFECGGTLYSHISYNSALELRYSTPSIVVYTNMTPPPIEPIPSKWSNQSYRTITITDTSALTNRDEFTTWLKANAVKQVPKVTDLTGTTWKWNETFSLYKVETDNRYKISFVSASNDFKELAVYGDRDYLVIEYSYLTPLADDKFVEVYYYDSNGQGTGWREQNYRTISITGGADATNTELIDYLYANAVLQSSQPEPVTYTVTYNLTNCYKPSGDTTATEGGSFTADIQAEQGFVITREQVSVTGATLSIFQSDSTVSDLYHLTFDNVTGNVTVSITAIVETIPAVSVAISTSEGTTITKGKYIVATAVLQPSDSTDSVTWTSSNPNVIVIENETDPKGKQVHLNGIKNGFSKITAVTDSGKTASLTFNVVTPSTAISIRAVSGASEVRQDNYITVDATLTPFDSTDRIVWRSSNNSILSLEQVAGDNKQIQVTGISPGTAEIIATTESGVSDSIQLSVYQLYNYDFKYYDGTLILALSNKRGIVRESLQYDETNNSVTLILFYNDGTSGTYTFDVLPKVGYNFRGFTTNKTGATPDIIIGESAFVVNANTVFYPYYEKKQEPPVTEQLQLNVYQNKAEANRVDKTDYILYVKTLTGVFRDDSDLINLSVIVEDDLPNYNYIYIPQLKRYYFVQGISSVRYRLWELSLSCDVLMTYKDGIRKLTAFVDRNENSTNNDIIDPKRVIEQGYDVEDNAVENNLFNTEHSFILTGFALKAQEKVETTT